MFGTYILTSIMLLITFSLYFLGGKTISLPNAFACIQVMFCLELPIKTIPYFISAYLKSVISTKRVQKFLLCDEVNPKLICSSDPELRNHNVSVYTHNANFTWGGVNSELKENESVPDNTTGQLLNNKISFHNSYGK